MGPNLDRHRRSARRVNLLSSVMDRYGEAVDRLLFDPCPPSEKWVDQLLESRVTVNPMWLQVALSEANRGLQDRERFEAGS